MSFLLFKELEQPGKTKRFEIWNTKNLHLGWISWHPPWRRYVMHTPEASLFDATCLMEITNKLHELMQERKSNESAPLQDSDSPL